MTDVGIDIGVPETPPTQVPGPAGNDPVSIREAARSLGKWRHEKPKETTEQKPAPERVEAAAPVQVEESTAQAEDTGAETPPGETQEIDPAQQPPIEPPRSWTKEDKELFAGLPRETQERLAERERSRDTDISRRQNEAAEKLKGLSAKEQAVEQARQQYESALPILMNNLQSAMAGEFSDIKTMQDVQKMAAEDWPRYIRWDAAQKQVAAVHQEVVAAQQRQQTESQTKFADFAKREGELFLEKVPDMADETKAKAFQSAAMETLRGIGFKDEELALAWQGKIYVPFRDHRVQLAIHKAALWDQAQAKAKTVVQNAKPLPPVQRPGAAQPRGAAQQAQIENLGKKLDNASGVRNQLRAAADMVKARRAAR
jgi:hypothetical protein